MIVCRLFGAVLLAQALSGAGQAQLLFREDFENLELGDSVHEIVPGQGVWTKTAPDGWTIDDTAVAGIENPEVGMTEWKGWSFANREWWAQTAEGQQRENFSRGTGTVAIADPDEWDDRGSPAALGTFNSFLSTPEIDVSAHGGTTLELGFDSSFRPEGNQRASLRVAFDGGAESVLIDWVNVPDTKTNERIEVPVLVPEGAGVLVITWGMTEAGNNWWWAIDNIELRSSALFSEDFEGLPLGPSVDEGLPGDNVWTKTPPEGWTVDDSGVAGINDQGVGVTEWKGWSFADREWWAATAGDQRRTEFTRGTGTVAVADPDEWDDAGSPSSIGTFNSFLTSPTISIADAPANSLTLAFDSAFRPEGNQRATLTVSYDGAAAITLLDWVTTGDDKTNEQIVLALGNPEGAASMVLTWGLTNAGNNWYWAIDNVVVTGAPIAICPVGLQATVDREAGSATLDWVAAANIPGGSIEILRDGALIDTLAMDANTYTDMPPVEGPGRIAYDYTVQVAGGGAGCEPLTAIALMQSGDTLKLAQWDFEEGAGLVAGNSLGDEFPGELVDLQASAWTAFDFLGGGLSFASDGFIDFGTSRDPVGDPSGQEQSDGLRPQFAVTLAAWVRPRSFVEWAGIAGSVYDTGSTESGFYLNTRSGGAGAGDFSWALATEGTPSLQYLRFQGVLDEWQHVAGTYDGAVRRLYLNGEEVASAPAVGPIKYDPKPFGFQVGTFIDDDEDTRFDGDITQVILWDGALSAEEIFFLYELGKEGEWIPPLEDSDGDGLRDTWEVEHFGDLTSQTGLDDPDGEGLNNVGEQKAGTDPNNADTDGDTASDLTEVAFGTDPLSAESVPPADGVAQATRTLLGQDWDTAEIWSDGAAPSAGKRYFSNGEVAKILRTPAAGEPVFGGNSLEMRNGAQLYVQSTAGRTGVAHLILEGAALVQNGAAGSTVILGRAADEIEVAGDSEIFFTGGGRAFDLAGRLTGDALLRLTPSGQGSNRPAAGEVVRVSGNNGAFSGDWEVQGVILKPATSNALGQGDVVLLDAGLDADVDVAMPGSTLTLFGADTVIYLDQNIQFGRVLIGDLELPEATYTYNDLLSLGFSPDNVIDGGGMLIVGGEVVDMDSDMDGLTDAEEAALGTDPNNPDSDGDGASDGAEVLKAGTSPLDAGSYLRILNLERGTDGNATVTWSSVEGKAYSVLFRPDGGGWTSVITGVDAAAGDSTSYTDDSHAADGGGLYRVSVD